MHSNVAMQVSLKSSALPTSAVSELYRANCAMPCGEDAILHAAVHLTWPQAMLDDDGYLAAFIAQLLLDESDMTVNERYQLPRCLCPACPCLCLVRQ